MIDIVIPIYNQVQNIEKIIKALNLQTVMPNNVFFVLDRTTVDDEKKLYFKNLGKYNISFIDFTTNEKDILDKKILVSAVRNSGIEKTCGDIVILIDGDCIPQNKMIEAHLENCKYNIPVLSCGLRREKRYRGDDRRKIDVPDLFTKNLIINNFSFIEKGKIVYTCNMALNRKAINLIYAFNEKYYGNKHIFNTSFDGVWGGEDIFLGVVAWLSRIFIVTCPKSYVEHIDHPEPSYIEKHKHVSIFNNMLNDILFRTSINPLSLDFFIG